MDTNPDTLARVQLEVWSDIACPWCYVGRRNLSVAIADLEERDRPEVQWRAYQLDPTIPVDGVDPDTYFAQRFGADLSKFEESRERLAAVGEELGIAFRWDRQRVIANTRLAHRVLAAAEPHGVREELLDVLFAANFERGIDIGDESALRALAAEVDDDLSDEIVDAALHDPTFEALVAAEIELGGELGITGVPCFVADRAIAVPGAVPPPVLAKLLTEAAARLHLDDD